ncbi:GYF domain-containing protein [Luteolibacter luteus]|uniref:DUF4339 domain-containing protein n=1 Tax=Luteolibacter luteus TaxID=2728835 RepID=A0A858RR83_9BACT|nr:GYF domain-containing protein [Luteolibacter luteus]QJE98443.1 DUF4339 domain-containing protein [Luteolibacter luteus]
MNWYYATNGTQKGPVPTEDLKSRIAMGEVSATDLAWREGMADWMPVGSIAELKPAEPEPRVEAAPPVSGIPSAPASHVPAASPAPQPYSPPGAPAGTVLAPPSQGLAIASMICGIIALIFCCGWVIALPLAIVAIVLGHIAISKVNANPQRYTGKGLARTGLITGYLGLVGAIVMAVVAMQFQGLSEAEVQEKIVNWFPKDMQQQMREQIEKEQQKRQAP